MKSYVEHEKQWREYFSQKQKHNREQAVKNAEKIYQINRAMRQLQLTKWDFYREQKDKKLGEIAKRQQIKEMLKFWSGICAFRAIVKKALKNLVEIK